MRFSGPLFGCLAVLLCGPRLAGASAALDYNRDIRPILSENCFACHGPDEKARKGKRRLDVADGAYADRSGIVAIKPGNANESDVWLRITSKDDEEVMPPPDSHRTLTDAQKQKIKTWIEQGATYAPHWSLVPPRKAGVPPIGANASPIDAFVRAKLAAEKLAPSPEADRAMLIRRVTLDLTGLPPSADEVAAFLADRDPQAYEKLVERLLASPHFGERMALDWLDAARYADTNGFSIDGGRHMWLWRDWVIQAFNDNKPYDQFLVEQIGGDLLPNRTEAQLIASGFQRNNMVTHEGGTIPEENLTNYNVDRVKTLGESVLGLTLGCAQCHDHKFDPITQKDYYRLYAFFNTLSDRGLDGNAGVNPAPFIKAKTVLHSDEVPQLKKQIAALEAELAHPDTAVLARWEKQQRELLAMRGKDFALHPVKVQKISTPNKGAGFDVEGENRVKIRDAGALAAFDILTTLPKTKTPITGLRVVMHPQPDLPGGGWGAGPDMGRRAPAAAKKAARTGGAGAPNRPGLQDNSPAGNQAGSEVRPPPVEKPDAAPQKGTFMLTAICATADVVPGDQVNLHKLLPIARVTANSWEPANPPRNVLDPRNETGWSPDLATEGPVHLTVTFAEPINPVATPYLTLQVNFGNGRNLIAGLVEVLAVTGNDDDTDLPAEIVGLLGGTSVRPVVPADRGQDAGTTLWRYCAQTCAELEPKRVALANLKERLTVLTEPFTTMVMDVAAKPRDTFILNRGDYAQPTVKVSAGTPAALPPMPEGAPPNRLGLAEWLVMKNHPLTARVAVNRIWKSFFGIGLVATAADFGAQGEPPSHPELLDWLAVDFIENNWDVKRLVRQIVTSQTYRQTSAASPALLERDPQNRLLARGPRFRLPAEFVRDTALKISGLLVPRVGGPSVNPYTPGDLWREISHYGSTPATSQTFVQDHGEKLYRRSLYTYWKRTAPPPNMLAFDAPNREVCVVARANTTTPLQALVLLNDVQFVEAARAFAARMMQATGAKSDTAKLRWGFIEATSREPRREELVVLENALKRERQRYRADPAEGGKLLSAGESPRDPRLPVPDHAAWTQVATLLLNLSETITRN